MAGALGASEGGARGEAAWAGRGHVSLPSSEMQAEPMQDGKSRKGVIRRENGVKGARVNVCPRCPWSESWWCP